MSAPADRRLVLFDIDGTLLAAGDPDHLRCLAEAMEHTFGRPVPLDGVPLGGNQDRAIARAAARAAGLDGAGLDRALDTVMAELGQRFVDAVTDRRGRLLPGVPTSLRTLAAGGWDLGVLSGGARVVSMHKLATAGLAELLPFGAFGDEHEDRAELVAVALGDGAGHHGVSWSPPNVVLVGDTPRDIHAARRADCGVVAVATGRHDGVELASHGPDAVLEDLADAEALVRACEAALDGVRDGAGQCENLPARMRSASIMSSSCAPDTTIRGSGTNSTSGSRPS